MDNNKLDRFLNIIKNENQNLYSIDEKTHKLISIHQANTASFYSPTVITGVMLLLLMTTFLGYYSYEQKKYYQHQLTQKELDSNKAFQDSEYIYSVLFMADSEEL